MRISEKELILSLKKNIDFYRSSLKFGLEHIRTLQRQILIIRNEIEMVENQNKIFENGIFQEENAISYMEKINAQKDNGQSGSEARERCEEVRDESQKG